VSLPPSLTCRSSCPLASFVTTSWPASPPSSTFSHAFHTAGCICATYSTTSTNAVHVSAFGTSACNKLSCTSLYRQCAQVDAQSEHVKALTRPAARLDPKLLLILALAVRDKSSGHCAYRNFDKPHLSALIGAFSAHASEIKLRSGHFPQARALLVFAALGCVCVDFALKSIALLLLAT
jgi:hypothetical protein